MLRVGFLWALTGTKDHHIISRHLGPGILAKHLFFLMPAIGLEVPLVTPFLLVDTCIYLEGTLPSEIQEAWSPTDNFQPIRPVLQCKGPSRQSCLNTQILY